MAGDRVAASLAPAEGTASPGRLSDLSGWLRQPGVLWSLPVVVFFAVGFLGPLIIVGVFAFMPARTFDLTGSPTFQNFVTIFERGFYRSYLWSVFLAGLTVLITLVVSYPLAYGIVKTFGARWANILVIVLSFPLLVSENIRLLGWTLILMKNGVLGGSVDALFGLELEGMLFNVPAIVLGLVYIYLPFMLFPLVLGLSMVPDDLVGSAHDLGASRLQVFREIELPLAKPGLLIGVLLTFVLSMGSVAEALIMGGKNVIMIVADIERAFSFQQNWPLGSALSVILLAVAGVLVWTLVRRLDMDLLLHKGD